MLIYTGIGSRQIPPEVWDQMVEIGSYLGRNGAVLRSGAAEGSDTAFEHGCDQVNGSKEIFLPWKGFNGHSSELYTPSGEAMKLAKEVHPSTNFSSLSQGVQRMHARNVHQVFGPDLIIPTDVVVCYTHDGCESHETRTEKTGGTGQAIELASRMNIPVFNLANEGRLQEFYEFIATKGDDHE